MQVDVELLGAVGIQMQLHTDSTPEFDAARKGNLAALADALGVADIQIKTNAGVVYLEQSVGDPAESIARSFGPVVPLQANTRAVRHGLKAHGLDVDGRHLRIGC